MTIRQRLADRLIAAFTRRPADFVIGLRADPYLQRWWVIPRNPLVNLYLHRILRSDDPRALHDHSYFNVSIILRGSYIEHTIAAGGVHRRTLREAGSVTFRSPWRAHRLEIAQGAAWSLFFTGPRLRAWGFHCPGGWIPWQAFTAPDDQGQVGRGCE